MKQQDYIRQVIEAYLDLPDTPNVASPGDFRIAAVMDDEGVPIAHVLRAIKLAFIRRWVRTDSANRLPKIHSLAYFRKVLDGLTEEELSSDFALYVDYKFDSIRPDPKAWLDAQKKMLTDPSKVNDKPGVNDQIPLILNSR